MTLVVKAEPNLKDMALVNNTRLSVQPVDDRGVERRLPHGRREALSRHSGRRHPLPDRRGGGGGGGGGVAEAGGG